MRPGDTVFYVPAPGRVTTAQVESVSAAGDSGYKTLAVITAAGFTVRNVPNVRDAYGAAGYWCQEVAEVIPPESARPKKRGRRTITDSDAES
jgi:hypothetical protein